METGAVRLITVRSSIPVGQELQQPHTSLLVIGAPTRLPRVFPRRLRYLNETHYLGDLSRLTAALRNPRARST